MNAHILLAVLALAACSEDASGATAAASPAAERAQPTPAEVQPDGDLPDPETRYSQTYRDCQTAADGVSGPTILCLTQERTRQEAALDALQARQTAGADETLARRIPQRHARWLANREQICTEAMSEDAGGSLGTLSYEQCMLAETTHRVMWLEAHPHD